MKNTLYDKIMEATFWVLILLGITAAILLPFQIASACMAGQ